MRDLVTEDLFWADFMKELRSGYATWRDEQSENDDIYDATEDSRQVSQWIKNELPKLLSNE